MIARHLIVWFLLAGRYDGLIDGCFRHGQES